MLTAGVYLRELRSLAKLTQKQAGDIIGVSYKTVERWEAGENEPSLSIMMRYVEHLRGSALRVFHLLMNNRVGLDQAKKWARQDYNNTIPISEQERAILSYLETLNPKQRDLAVGVLQQMLSHEVDDSEW